MLDLIRTVIDTKSPMTCVLKVVRLDYLGWPVTPKLTSNPTHNDLQRNLNCPPTKWSVNSAATRQRSYRLTRESQNATVFWTPRLSLLLVQQCGSPAPSFTTYGDSHRLAGTIQHRYQLVDGNTIEPASHQITDIGLTDDKKFSCLNLCHAAMLNEFRERNHQCAADLQVSFSCSRDTKFP